MALVREFFARTLVVLALIAGTAALGLWWASLLTIRTAGTLDSINLSATAHQIAAQLDNIAPGTSALPGVESDIESALRNPAITQALATSTSKGSSALTSQLSRVDSTLASVLSGQHLFVNAGRHDLASLASRLKEGAALAGILAATAAAVALVLAPMRHLVLRHLAVGASLVGGIAALVAWALPDLVGHVTHGGVNHVATNVLRGGEPVRAVLLECLIGGAVVFAASHLFEILYTGKRVAFDASAAPLARGEVV